MKKIILGVFVFVLLILSTSVSAQTSYQIYVHDVKVEKPTYGVGENVKGEFSISNLSDIPQSDIMYTISSGKYNPETLLVETTQGATTKKGPLYIQAQAKDTISFEYTLPQSLAGVSAIEITANLKDGTFVGQGYVRIKIVGEPTKEQVISTSSVLVLNEANLVTKPSSGPTVYEGETITYSYTLAPTKEVYTFTPTLKLYNRNNNEEDLVKTFVLPDVQTNTEEFVNISVDLPVELTPLVYYGVISFETNNSAELSDLDLRYIIAGPIATVRNITTDILEVDEGDTIPFLLTYGRQPVDEFRPEKQITLEGANIYVEVMNEKGNIIGTVKSPLDIKKDEIQLSVTSNNSAESLSFNATITDLQGNMLSSYQTELPTQDSVDSQISYIKEHALSSLTIGSIVLLLLLIILLLYFKKKHSILNVPLSILVFALLVSTGIFGYRDAQAWEFYEGHIFTSEGLFHITAVTSPLPPELKVYAPGEVFNLSFSASYGDCNNASEYFYAFMYKDGIEWWNEVPDVRTTNDWAGDYTYNATYWANKGIELFSTIYGANKLSSFVTSSNCSSIGGKWVATRGFIGCTFNEYDDKRFSFTRTYTAPTTPGKHKIYFAMFQSGDDKSGNGIADGYQNATYFQEICVMDANGVCPDSSVPPVEDVCTSLTGAQIQVGDTIYEENGDATDYVSDGAGYCESSLCKPNFEPVGYGLSCGCVATGEVGTIGCNGSCISSTTGEVIPATCGEFTVSCTADPAVLGQPTVVEIQTFNPVVPNWIHVYWSTPFTNNNFDDESTFNVIFSKTGQYPININAESDAGEAEALCYATINCDTSQDAGQYCNLDGYYHNWICSEDGWEDVSTTNPCGVGAPISNGYSFEPDTVEEGSNCPLYLDIDNVSSCQIINRLGEPFTVGANSLYKIDINGTEDFPIGTYRGECLGSDGVSTTSIGVISCFSKSKVKEN